HTIYFRKLICYESLPVVFENHFELISLLLQRKRNIPGLRMNKRICHCFLKDQVCLATKSIWNGNAAFNFVIRAKIDVFLVEQLVSKVADVNKKFRQLVVHRVYTPDKIPRPGV